MAGCLRSNTVCHQNRPRRNENEKRAVHVSGYRRYEPFRLGNSKESVEREDLLQKFNTLYVKLGELSSAFRDAVEDNEVDKHERHLLDRIGQDINQTVQELLALTFLIYCDQGNAG